MPKIPERTFGWIQNPSNFSNLKKTVAVFLYDSPINLRLRTDLLPRLIQDETVRNTFISELSRSEIVIPYEHLKGKGKGSAPSRKEALCSGIVQAVIHSQGEKEYTDDWTADGFLRWGVSLGFIEYNHENDCCQITESGKEFVLSEEDSEREKELLGNAFLSYPPVIRILSLLDKNGDQTKFELGAQLGFIGEAGFTSIPQNLYVAALCQAEGKERTNIRSNVEGSSDKYARMIAKWLAKMGWIVSKDKIISETLGNKTFQTRLQAYEITLEGRRNLKRAQGNSSSVRIPRRVFYEMLATKVTDKNYLRQRRAYLIQYLAKRRSCEEIQKFLQKKGISVQPTLIRDEIESLERIGLNIQKFYDETYVITDEIVGLSIPETVENVKLSDLTTLKENVREKLTYLNHKYLLLLDLAQDKDSSRDFEIQTADLLTNELEFSGTVLGGPRRPDSVVSYGENGIIIDNKAYKEGFSIPIHQADEMIRYINDNNKRDPELNPNRWWEHFDSQVVNFYYLFVSSFFTGNFKRQLEYITRRTEQKNGFVHTIGGGAVAVVNLLYLAEKLKSGKMQYKDCFSLFQNDEIVISL